MAAACLEIQRIRVAELHMQAKRAAPVPVPARSRDHRRHEAEHGRQLHHVEPLLYHGAYRGAQAVALAALVRRALAAALVLVVNVLILAPAARQLAV